MLWCTACRSTSTEHGCNERVACSLTITSVTASNPECALHACWDGPKPFTWVQLTATPQQVISVVHMLFTEECWCCSHVEFEQMQMMARLQAQHLSSQQPHTQNSSYYPGGNFSGEGFSNGGSEAAEWQQQAADDGTAQPEEHPVQQQEIEEDSRGKSKAQMKNQKKHQRQRERKAKELRNQCLQLVVDWKLNSLAAPLIAMGFPQDQCIDAVCACSDGKAAVDLERCVSWIVNQQSKGSAFSFGAEDPKHKDSRQPDIDITDEMQKMTEAEAKMGVTSADVERAVLAHNGDVNSACQSLVQGSNSSNGYTSTMVH